MVACSLQIDEYVLAALFRDRRFDEYAKMSEICPNEQNLSIVVVVNFANTLHE